jgi:hypothetical protein
VQAKSIVGNQVDSKKLRQARAAGLLPKIHKKMPWDIAKPKTSNKFAASRVAMRFNSLAARWHRTGDFPQFGDDATLRQFANSIPDIVDRSQAAFLNASLHRIRSDQAHEHEIRACRIALTGFMATSEDIFPAAQCREILLIIAGVELNPGPFIGDLIIAVLHIAVVSTHLHEEVPPLVYWAAIITAFMCIRLIRILLSIGGVETNPGPEPGVFESDRPCGSTSTVDCFVIRRNHAVTAVCNECAATMIPVPGRRGKWRHPTCPVVGNTPIAVPTPTPTIARKNLDTIEVKPVPIVVSSSIVESPVVTIVPKVDDTHSSVNSTSLPKVEPKLVTPVRGVVDGLHLSTDEMEDFVESLGGNKHTLTFTRGTLKYNDDDARLCTQLMVPVLKRDVVIHQIKFTGPASLFRRIVACLMHLLVYSIQLALILAAGLMPFIDLWLLPIAGFFVYTMYSVNPAHHRIDRYCGTVDCVVQYVPHIVSLIMYEYERGTNEAVLTAGIRQKVRRASCLPLPDKVVIPLIEGTEAIAKFMIRTASSFTTPGVDLGALPVED